MGDFLIEFKRFFRKGDMVLLALCLTATVFGLLVIASATNAVNSTRYIILQGFSAVIGVLFYAVMSSIDVDTFSEHRTALVIFNVLLLSLLIPFGVNIGGNKSWIKLPLVPFNIQPAEICKVTYILIMASVMNSHQNRISSIPSVMHMVVHLGLLVGLNMVLSGDAGVSLIFVFIFAGMAFSGGVSLWWFLLAAGGLIAVVPFAWNHLMATYQKNRILVLFDPTIDPQGRDERYHTMQSLRSLTGGGVTGTGPRPTTWWPVTQTIFSLPSARSWASWDVLPLWSCCCSSSSAAFMLVSAARTICAAWCALERLRR